jgi:hypothetical protein
MARTSLAAKFISGACRGAANQSHTFFIENFLILSKKKENGLSRLCWPFEGFKKNEKSLKVDKLQSRGSRHIYVLR